MKGIEYKISDSSVNDKLDEFWKQVDPLRIEAHKQDDVKWFLLLNEVCIWIGKQYEFEAVEIEDGVNTKKDYHEKYGPRVPAPNGMLPEWYQNLPEG